METLKFATFAITVRPRNGISDAQVRLVTHWIKKRSTYYHVVTEKTGLSRHLHAGMYLKTAVTRSNLLTVLIRLGKSLELQDDELSVLRSGLRIMYNGDFVSEYLDKGDDTEVIATNLPEVSHLEKYYPPKPAEPSAQKAARHSAQYWELEKLWYEYMRPMDEVNTENARHFLFQMMYSKRLIPVLRDDKAIIQVARHLVRWINKTEFSTIELPPFEKEE